MTAPHDPTDPRRTDPRPTAPQTEPVPTSPGVSWPAPPQDAVLRDAPHAAVTPPPSGPAPVRWSGRRTAAVAALALALTSAGALAAAAASPDGISGPTEQRGGGGFGGPGTRHLGPGGGVQGPGVQPGGGQPGGPPAVGAPGQGRGNH